MAKKGNFFIRLCYGYVGRYKDTSKMTTKEVVEEFLKRKGVSSPREFFQKRFVGIRQSGAKLDLEKGGIAEDTAMIYRKLKNDEQAERFYEDIRKNTDDVKSISENINMPISDVVMAKNHLFYEEHDLDKGHIRFEADMEIAESWQRLVNGDFLPKDVVLVKHELLESIYMKQGLSYREAHAKANLKFNYEIL